MIRPTEGERNVQHGLDCRGRKSRNGKAWGIEGGRASVVVLHKADGHVARRCVRGAGWMEEEQRRRPHRQLYEQSHDG